MSDLAFFLETIALDPYDPQAREAFAQWLSAQGDPNAAFVALPLRKPIEFIGALEEFEDDPWCASYEQLPPAWQDAFRLPLCAPRQIGLQMRYSPQSTPPRYAHLEIQASPSSIEGAEVLDCTDPFHNPHPWQDAFFEAAHATLQEWAKGGFRLCHTEVRLLRLRHHPICTNAQSVAFCTRRLLRDLFSTHLVPCRH